LLIVLAIAFPAQAFATNCYVIAPGEGEECLIVDPGIGVEDTVAEVLAQYRLKPAAVLLTHGHLDHVYAVAPVCGGNTAAYIHGDDRYRLQDPLALVNPGEELTRTMVSGDVLFAGSIGRTDLPGGSADLMTRSLREVVLPLPDDTLVLTGHGPATTMRRERATNPYLQGL